MQGSNLVLKCHLCNRIQDLPRTCPQCQSKKIFSGGFGTERVEEQLKEIWPWAKIKRWDLDNASQNQFYDQTLTQMHRHEIDILVGTSLVSQGFDFPNVTLVGILNADETLFHPDFRSSEKAFSQIMQVS